MSKKNFVFVKGAYILLCLALIKGSATTTVLYITINVHTCYLTLPNSQPHTQALLVINKSVSVTYTDQLKIKHACKYVFIFSSTS